MADSPNGAVRGLTRWVTAPRTAPFLRLTLTALVVMLVDHATEHLTQGGGAIDSLVVTAIRLVASVTVLWMPLSGAVVALEADKWDWFWMRIGERGAEAQALYQQWDKLLDLVFLGLATIVAVRWLDRRARDLMFATFLWRAVGVAVFLVLGQGWVLVGFPNVVESLFLLYMVFHVLTGHEQMLRTRGIAVLVMVAVTIPKLGEEYFLHVLNDRPWHVLHLPLIPEIAQAWVWGAAMYALPLAVLVYLILTARDRPTQQDPEEELSVI